MLNADEYKVIDNYLIFKDSKILENIPEERLSLILEEISRKEFVKEDSVQDNLKVNLKSHPVFQNSLNKILNLGNEDFLNFKRFSRELEQELSISEQNDAVIESMGENLKENFTQVCIKEEEIDQVLGEIRENMDYTVSKTVNRKIAWSSSSLEGNKIPELENSDKFFKEILEKYTEIPKKEDCKISDIYNQKSFCRFWPSSQNKSLKKSKKRKKKSKSIESDKAAQSEEIIESRNEDVLGSEENSSVKDVHELLLTENSNVKDVNDDVLDSEENSSVKDVHELLLTENSNVKDVNEDVLGSEEISSVKDVHELGSTENSNVKDFNEDVLGSEEISSVKDVHELLLTENSNVKDVNDDVLDSKENSSVKDVHELLLTENSNVKDVNEDVLDSKENSSVKDAVGLEKLAHKENASSIGAQDIVGLNETVRLDISKGDVSIIKPLSPNLDQDQEENPLEYINLNDLKEIKEFGSENIVNDHVEHKEVEVASKEGNSHNAIRAKLNTGKKKKKKNRTKITAKIVKQEFSPSRNSVNLTESIAPSNLSNAILPNTILSDMIRDAPISNDLPMPEYDWNFFPESPSPESFYDHEEVIYPEFMADVAVQVTPNSDLSLEIQKVAVEEVDLPDTCSDVTQTHFESQTQYVEDKHLKKQMYEIAGLKEFVSTALHPSEFLKHGLVHQPPPGYTYVYTLGYIPFSQEPYPIYILVPLSELDPELQKYFNADLFEKAQSESFLFNRWELAQKAMAVIREQDLPLLTPNSETWLSFSSHLT